MPYEAMTMERWWQLTSRILIAGEPNSRKTTSLLTWPRPLHVVVSPGEKGAASIRHDPEEGVFVYTFKDDFGSKAIPSVQIVKQVRDQTIAVLSGKCGQVESFAFDGLHKFHDYVLDAVTGGEYLTGGEFDPKLYGPAQRETMQFLTSILQCPVPNVVLTVWTAPEKDKPFDKASTSMHIWPDLPGRAAKRLLGEFTAVLYATFRPGPKPGTPPEPVWQLQPDSEVWGVGVKCPEDIAKTLPKYIPQSHNHLMQILKGEEVKP